MPASPRSSPPRAAPPLLFAALLLLGACVAEAPEPDCAPHTSALSSSAMVTARQGRFWLGSTPFNFLGTNLYYAVEASQRGQLDQVEAVFDEAAAMGVSVVRIWAFNTDPRSPEIIHSGPDAIDEAGLVALDRVLEAARARGLRLILTLTNHWTDYGGLDAYGAWEGLSDRAAMLQSPRVRDHLTRFALTLAERVNTLSGVAYNQDPAIFGWEIINEPRCPGCSPSLMADFLLAVADDLRIADPNHLIGVGDEGFQGQEGVDVRLHARSGAFDWVSVHVWPQSWTSLSAPSGDQRLSEARAAALGRRWIAQGAQVARAAGLPLIIGEMGWPSWAGSPIEQASLVSAWLDEARRQQAGGAMLWMLVDPGRPDYDGYAIAARRHPAMRAVLCGFAPRERAPEARETP